MMMMTYLRFLPVIERLSYVKEARSRWSGRADG